MCVHETIMLLKYKKIDFAASYKLLKNPGIYEF